MKCELNVNIRIYNLSINIKNGFETPFRRIIIDIKITIRRKT